MFVILGSDGKEYGPVTTGNVGEWIRDGRANLQTKAKRDEETEWKTLAEYTEFCPSRSTPPLVAPPLIVSAAPAWPAAEAESASRWLRLPAAMIDGLLKTLCYLPITIPLVRVVFTEALSGEQRSFNEIRQLTSAVVDEHLLQALPLFGALVLIQFILLVWRGQSVGKLLLGLRIVRHSDGSAPGFLHVFFLRGTVPFVIEQIPFVGLAFWAVDSCFIFRDDRRCLHDLIAGTRVVVK